MERTLIRYAAPVPANLQPKLVHDEAPNLAALLAWDMLSTLLPLLLGILAIGGLVLRDPQHLDQGL
jgi:uncharacterized BrkB/YihY/UPF0761 family membrane protein